MSVSSRNVRILHDPEEDEMRRVLRTVAAAVLAIGGVVGVAGVAAATVPPATGCEEEGDGYFGGGVCQAVVEATAVCEGGVPYLDYTAVLEGTPNSDVTVTWNNPSGPGQVLADQPLSGRLLWPGTVLDDDGAAADYPGWNRNDDGSWSRGDAFSWAAGTVDVTFSSNPEATVSVVYPEESGACAPVSPTSTGGGDVAAAAPTEGGGVLGISVLSDTGISAAPLLGAVGGLLLAGTLLLLVGRVRRSPGEDG